MVADAETVDTNKEATRTASPPSKPRPRVNRPASYLCYSVYSVSNMVGIRELRQQASAVLRRVVAGEVIEITDHGHPIARIVPLRHSVLDQLVLEGRASEADGDLVDLMDELGLPAVADGGGPSPSRALAELRSDER